MTLWFNELQRPDPEAFIQNEGYLLLLEGKNGAGCETRTTVEAMRTSRNPLRQFAFVLVDEKTGKAVKSVRAFSSIEEAVAAAAGVLGWR
jgi:hypothetical protein